MNDLNASPAAAEAPESADTTLSSSIWKNAENLWGNCVLFRMQYVREVVVPSMRGALPWLNQPHNGEFA